MPAFTRRQLLAGASVALGTATAGCSFGLGNPAEDVPVTITNEHSASHTIGVSVDVDEVRVFERRPKLEPEETASGSFENPDESTAARVSAQVESGPSGTKRVGIGAGSGIRSIDVRIAADGTLGIVATRT